jgi:hypothetical protein
VHDGGGSALGKAAYDRSFATCNKHLELQTIPSCHCSIEVSVRNLRRLFG